MEIKQSEFITSAVHASQYPRDNREEIAFVGRSNVGKSSLINSLVNRKNLVKVSSTPGKTRLINFFLINRQFYFVDLPGYGYAKVSKREIESWGNIVEEYLHDREQLKVIVLILDCRHKPTADDITMYKWIKHYDYKIIIVATKIDKVSKNKLYGNLKIIRDTLKLEKDDRILTFSALNKQGKEEIWNTLDSMLDFIS
ncbi:ribosome biogenesis GTP-binding protein YihA/YsxC [Clostridium luticellarii]|jgi:GTP-binding protein|uniref:Probable GTP-binding protein EngB n=1 Tax=Clostridium luticellarii TaxID=1691940 RepID=A0A2T0BQA0_9CLOT|nr:ribosome biogenesis GTP-binding protein YihA/YsxC [Clostridium luticellarii]MCI1944451.1 ribosome biogenesis GTP-binding protein YihA/YsxC [Clostridium luticellarii]MCI1967950.1 ribosome biogenesis GTP-binding protein YihA/YsxC [Clostridium luticellarii]MCI1995111.1 ribosome biogenesis GTP-binding protein YihA/YsxC [Clostridium luticellarii]MCI2039270.1 ribosome biogenesis GTP-binding protein YihA/YsxC [Clostridium luticellarii]PRR86050.1 putative GTP-binding protein EngB [Clostridium lutic